MLSIRQAFRKDGYRTQQVKRYRGAIGYMAEHKKVEGRKAFYLEGGAYETGYILGYLAEPAVTQMVTTYLDHLLPEFLNYRWDIMMSQDPKWKDIYRELLDELHNYYLEVSYKFFLKVEKEGVFPRALIDEMEGIAKGCKAVNKKTVVSFKNLIALNYGLEVLVGSMYSGDIVAAVKKRLGKDPKVRDLVSKLNISMFHTPDACNGFYVKNEGTKTGYPIFARDFQFPNGQVFGKINAMFIYNPTDGRLPSICASAPGMVAAITGYNSAGLSVSVDMVRSATTRMNDPGFGSILLARHLVDNCKTCDQAFNLLARTKRFTPWIYHVADPKTSIIIEAGMSGSFDPLNMVEPSVKDYLPTKAILKSVSKPKNRNGAYVRGMRYKYPTCMLDYNKELFDRVGLDKIYKRAKWGETGFVYKSFQEENEVEGEIQNNYFPPLRTYDNPDLILVSNSYIIPQMRLTQMARVPNILAKTADAINWRYSSLNKLCLQNWGKITVPVAKKIISMLNPFKSPDYPTNKEQLDVSEKLYGMNKLEPGKVEIQGLMNVVDYETKIFYTKGGYWGNGVKSGWTELTLANYLG